MSEAKKTCAESRCGLRCTGCAWKESHGCGGCIETMGNPFHGPCPVAECCQAKGYNHCGECEESPCDLMFRYSFLDVEHGDQGERIRTCRAWAAQESKNVWDCVLLTSAGWTDGHGNVYQPILDAFLGMLDVPPEQARVLFIDEAALDAEDRARAAVCKEELMLAGIREENIIRHDMDNPISPEEALACDAIYFTGGNTAHLLRRLKETGFDKIVKQMVYANRAYVGVSAGSLIATPNTGDPSDDTTTGLALVHAYISVHTEPDALPRTDLLLPHIPLSDHQALRVTWSGHKKIS